MIVARVQIKAVVVIRARDRGRIKAVVVEELSRFDNSQNVKMSLSFTVHSETSFREFPKRRNERATAAR